MNNTATNRTANNSPCPTVRKQIGISTRSTRLALICRRGSVCVRDKLSADIIIKQTVSLSPEIVLDENTDIEAWDSVIENNDELLAKYIAGESISREKTCAGGTAAGSRRASLFPVYHGSAKMALAFNR